jgi:hypothetical protein
MGIETIIAAVALILTAGQTYYARQGNVSEERKRRVCASLAALIRALEGIAHTGEEIGSRLQHRAVYHVHGEELETLLHLLEIQRENLSAAQREFETLSRIFDVQLPEIATLVVHLRGKRDRIEILYTSARDVRGELRRLTQPEESSEVVPPQELRRVIAHRADPLQVQQNTQVLTAPDPYFEKIIAVIPDIRRFAQQHCSVEYLL